MGGGRLQEAVVGELSDLKTEWDRRNSIPSSVGNKQKINVTCVNEEDNIVTWNQ